MTFIVGVSARLVIDGMQPLIPQIRLHSWHLNLVMMNNELKCPTRSHPRYGESHLDSILLPLRHELAQTRLLWSQLLILFLMGRSLFGG
jgi:hypothetical protein